MNWPRRLARLVIQSRDELLAEEVRRASRLRSKLRHAGKEKARLLRRLSATLEERRRLTGQLEATQASLTESRELLSQTRAREQTLADALRRSRQEAEHFRARGDALDKQARRYRQVRHEIEELSRQHDQRITEVTGALESSQQVRHQLMRQLTVRDETIAAQESRLSEIAGIKQALDGELLRLQGVLEGKENELAAAKEERTQLLQSLESAREGGRTQQGTIAELNAELEAARVEIERLGSALEADASVISHQRAEIDRLTPMEGAFDDLLATYGALQAAHGETAGQLARASQELGGLRRWIATVNRLETGLDNEPSPDTLLEAVGELLHFQRATLAAMKSGRDELQIEVASKSPIEVAAMLRLKRGQGVAGWSLEHRQPLLVADSRRDERFVVASVDNAPASYLAVPLVFDAGEAMVLTLSRSVDDPFSEDDLRVVHEFCRQAERKLSQASSAVSLRVRASLLEELQEASRDLLSASDRQQLISGILRAACKMGDAPAALLALHDNRTFVLEPAGSFAFPDELADSRLGWGAPMATMASKSGESWLVPIEEALPNQLALIAKASGIDALLSVPCQTAPLLCEVRDDLLIARPDPLTRLQADEVRGVLNVYRNTNNPPATAQLEQLQLLASYGVAALKAIGERDRLKRELRVTASLSAHMLGRERQIEQLQTRLRALEESLSV